MMKRVPTPNKMYWFKFTFFAAGFMVAMTFAILLFGVEGWPKLDSSSLRFGIGLVFSDVLMLCQLNHRWRSVDDLRDN